MQTFVMVGEVVVTVVGGGVGRAVGLIPRDGVATHVVTLRPSLKAAKPSG
jgi:hypothetical protein